MGTSLRPRIGITCYREPAAWGAWQEKADLLAADYVDSVVRAGGIPLLLPAVPVEPEAAARSVLEGLDGLILAGGHDIDGALYGQVRHPTSDEPRTERDQWELTLLRCALAAPVPLLGVCRGLQVLNVALGGTLHQHLPEVVGSEMHRPALGRFSPHPVTLDPTTRVGRIYGRHLQVPGHHHQGIDCLAPALVATGWADDGLIEAVELPGTHWVVGVQWHPEAGGGEPLFAEFVREAAHFRDCSPPEAGHDAIASGSGAPV